MITTPSHPGRVRLYGGRNTHAAREITSGFHVTACGYTLSPDSTNHWMPNTSTVSCRRCAAAATPGPDNGGAA